MLEVKQKDCLGRNCLFHSRKGTIKTPNLLPVINPLKLVITPAEMKKLFGTEIIITNSYIIYRNENVRKEAETYGLHKMLDFSGPIMTDSGTFQWYMYGDIKVTNREILDFQQSIGSDIATILDIFSTPDRTKEEATEDVEETVRRAKEAASLNYDFILSTPVQGSVYPALRKKCAEMLSPFGGFFPVGGVVPIMENYRYNDLVKIMLGAKKGLPPEAPVHLFGAGHPMMFALAASCGMDFFDSSSYVKYAADDRYMFVHGTEHLCDMEEFYCNCPACRSYTPSELRKITKKERIRVISMHNLYESFSEIRRVREAIRTGRLWELVELRAAMHSSMQTVIPEIYGHNTCLEKHEGITKKSSFVPLGPDSFKRPDIRAFSKTLEKNYIHRSGKILIVKEPGKPFRNHLTEDQKLHIIKGGGIIFHTALGPIPLGLDLTYPVAQSIYSDELKSRQISFLNGRTARYVKKLEARKSFGNHHKTIPELKESIKMDGYEPDGLEATIMITGAAAIIDYQFGAGAADILLSGEIVFKISKNTGKLRNIIKDGRHILSLRAEDSLFTLKFSGGELLLKHSLGKIVKVDGDSAQFNAMGRNVFGKFIISADKKIKPMDEVIITTGKKSIVAVGRALVSGEEMPCYKKGIAIEVREGKNKQKEE